MPTIAGISERKNITLHDNKGENGFFIIRQNNVK